MTGWDRLAPCYKTLEIVSFGPFLQRARCAWIDELGDRKNILLLGEGNGRFLDIALEIAPPDARFTVVDGSEGMIAAAKRQIGAKAERVKFIPARLPEELEKIGDRSPFDAVTAHFFFDCFTSEEVSKIVECITAKTSSDAIWLVSEFHIPDKPWWKRTSSRLLVGSLYTAFRLLTGLRTRRLPNWESAMEASGVECENSRTRSIGFTMSSMWTGV